MGSVAVETSHVSAHICAHCGLPASSRIVRDNHYFCCVGCKTVYQIIHASGLADFYKLKESGVCIRPASPALSRGISYRSWDKEERLYRLYIEGVHCSACLWLLEKLPQVLPEEIVESRLDLGHSLLTVKLNLNGKISVVASLIDSWGYRPHLIDNSDQLYDLQKKENRSWLIDLATAGFLASNIMLMSIPLYSGVSGEWERLFEWIAAGLATISVFYSGRKFFTNVWNAVKDRRFSIDAPILLAIVTAYFYSLASLLSGGHSLYFDSLSSLIFLLLASRYLLLRLRQLGLGKKESFELTEPTQSYQLGEIVELKAGKVLEFDGIVRGGRAFINTAVLTGESFPVEHVPGDLVYAGTQIVNVKNDNELLAIEVMAIHENTRMQKIFSTVKELSHKKSHVEKIFDNWAKALLTVVVFLAIGTTVYWYWQGDINEGIRRSLALLIVTCPCALALATPLAQTLVLRRGLANGLLIKDVDAFEQAADIKVIAFDKTGTLTEGQMHIDEMNISKSFIPVLRSLVWPSRHPIARAIAAEIGLGDQVQIQNWHETPGFGIEAYYAGEKIALIKPRNLKSEESRPAAELQIDGDVIGQVFLKDQLRSESKQLIQNLRAQGFDMALISGDRPLVVEAIARELNFRPDEVIAGASPEDKSNWVKKVEDNHHKSIFVGDGVNDALAMSRATLSFAVQGGIENVLKSASVVSLKAGLSPVATFFKLASDLRSLHKMNFVYSTLYNAISGSLAVMGLMNPLIAAVIMPLSALTVFLATSLRVKKGQLSEVVQ